MKGLTMDGQDPNSSPATETPWVTLSQAFLSVQLPPRGCCKDKMEERTPLMSYIY